MIIGCNCKEYDPGCFICVNTRKAEEAGHADYHRGISSFCPPKEWGFYTDMWELGWKKAQSEAREKRRVEKFEVITHL